MQIAVKKTVTCMKNEVPRNKTSKPGLAVMAMNTWLIEVQLAPTARPDTGRAAGFTQESSGLIRH